MAAKTDKPSEKGGEATTKAKEGNVVKKKKKYRGKKKKGDEKRSVITRLPSSGGELSCNWKRMMAEIAPASKPGNKKAWKGKKSAAPKVEKKEKSKPDIWFDDVDEMLLDPEDRSAVQGSSKKAKGGRGEGLVKEKAFHG